MVKNKTIENILKRQTIREYKPEQIGVEELEALIAAALRAPSGRNSQPCHLRFIQNAQMLHDMHIDFKNIVGWDTPVHTKSDKNPFYHNAPTFAVIFAQGDSYMDGGLMAENICIAAQSIGLGTCIVASVGALYADEDKGRKWKKAIDIDEEYKFLIAVCIGTPDEKPEMKPRFEDRIKVIN
ncbi:MAG TPA: nitroreductase family protein [Clostridia bacterium]|nr:nitroreductase family protein [Clostridia bacterium]